MTAEQTATDLRAVLSQMNVINKQCRELKLKAGYDQLKTQADALKKALHQHMDTQDLAEFGGYKLSFVTPNEEKRELRREVRRQRYSEVLTRALPSVPEDRVDLAAGLLVAV
jgi:hypothetical protein